MLIKRWLEHTTVKLIDGSYDLKTEQKTKYVFEASKPYSYNEKIIIAGDILEYYKYESPVLKNFKMKIRSKGRQTLSKDKEKREDKINQTIKNLRRLINANVDNKSCFITLTYKLNFQDISAAKNDFKNFIKRWNYSRSKNNQLPLKYVYVIEFQKRGAIHFHVIFFSLEYTKAQTIRYLWDHGRIDIKLIDNIDNVGSYLLKYMTKDKLDPRLKGHDMYGRSKGNLQEPIEVIKKELVEKLLKENINNHVYENTFKNKYNNTNITYVQINKKRIRKYIKRRAG